MLNSDIYKAMAHPMRRDILRLLRAGPQTAGELASHYEISKPSLSSHFTILKSADLIFSRRDGNHIYYFLNVTIADEIISAIMDLFGVEKEEKT